MFDISFVELLLVAIVALLVIGPERLPETVRTVTMWIGRLKRSLRETRREIEQQLGADEIRAQLHNEEIMRNLAKMREEMDTLKKEVHLESELYDSSGDARPSTAQDDSHEAGPQQETLQQDNPTEESSTIESTTQPGEPDSRPSEQK